MVRPSYLCKGLIERLSYSKYPLELHNHSRKKSLGRLFARGFFFLAFLGFAVSSVAGYCELPLGILSFDPSCGSYRTEDECCELRKRGNRIAKCEERVRKRIQSGNEIDALET